jgi:transcriptional regulator with XRE-family HTH domain
MPKAKAGVVASKAEIGSRLKAERERIGLSLDELADVGEVSRGTQWNYERGQSTPRTDYLARCRDRGIDVNYVLGGSKFLDSISKFVDTSTLAANVYGIIERHAGGAKQSLPLASRTELMKELLDLIGEPRR